ncbi:MAG: vitamin B12 dependent methionine synthase [Acidaminobacter sp.]|uniref:vitamin B12 dependent methionine synthase n=1 Tax=Acidaminobacter sp. TaxID=1872102 RepID=UPI001384CBBD|nr:vitamin B12 dependent methionine synthase [Acidaminobacter sp.]MZQ97494.1 vitamin B12 dependent methionine synthase [Acidaminobacter sp.]
MNELNIELLSGEAIVLEIQSLADKLKVKENTYVHDRLCELAAEAREKWEPKGIYRLSCIEEKGHNFVKAEGVCFSSSLLSSNLNHTNRFFAYIATCGKELEDWARTFTDMIDIYLVDAILQESCLKMRDILFCDMERKYGVIKASVMCPGALPDWPINEQTALFGLFNGWERRIGVELLDSYLMLPIKSVSGIRYESDVDFSNCQLCPRKKCSDRTTDFLSGKRLML